MVLTIGCLVSIARPCMWDTDTLKEEASLGKDYLATIVGRFPRNPPLYFEMRRDRILKAGPRKPSDFDDLAVAYERLGDSLTALKWIDRKPRGGTSDDRYRTFANRGTFLVHAWLAGKRPYASGVEGLRNLEAAVKINPNAHFGREWAQILLVKALLHGGYYEDAGDGGEALGIAGIIRLGSGWESPDAFRALATALGHQRLGAFAKMAIFRAQELEKAGRKGRLDFGSDEMVAGAQIGTLEYDTREEYDRLRALSDEWQRRRTKFMLARLEKGRHPDTDPHFWDGWDDQPKIAIERPWRLHFAGMYLLSPWWLLCPAGCVTLPAVALGGWLVRRRRAKLKAS